MLENKTFRIAVIAGDGVGQEVIPPATSLLETLGKRFDFAFKFTRYDWGADYYFANGRMMPENAIDLLKNSDAIFLGAVGHPKIPDHITLNGLLLPIRRSFDQFANVRPAVLYSGVTSPLAGYVGGDIDMVIVRENTEGEYAQVGGFVHGGHDGEVAIQTSVFTKAAIDRVIRFAFQLARKRNGKKKVTSITKSNAQAYGMVLWDRIFDQVSDDYPDISTESLLVDAAAMNFIRRPKSFDVVVASNLFGDILSDLSAIITGSMGLAPSANLDPLRRFPSMFEPVHGSAPDIAGQGIVNPLATVLASAMMLEHLGCAEAAQVLDGAVQQLLNERRVLTGDLGGRSTTHEVFQALEEKITARSPGSNAEPSHGVSALPSVPLGIDP